MNHLFCIIRTLHHRVCKTGRNAFALILPLIFSHPAGLFFLILTGGCIFKGAAIKTNEKAGFNGSFEVISDGLPANWYVYEFPAKDSDYDLIVDSTDFRDGKQSLRFVIRSCSPTGGRFSPGIFNEMAVQTDKNYLVSFWLKNEGCKGMVRMDSYKWGTTDRDHPKKWINLSDSIPDWQKFEYEFPFRNGLDRFRFELNIQSPGTLWIDDIRIEQSK